MVRSAIDGCQGEKPARVSRSRNEPGTYQAGQLTSEFGNTAVADTVVAKVAGIATRELPGVYAMGVGLDLVVEYGISIPDLAEGVRRNVIDAVERICGLEVTEVNITIGDVHLPTDEDPDPTAEPRVQ